MSQASHVSRLPESDLLAPNKFQLLLGKEPLEEGHGFSRATNATAIDGFSR